MNRTMRCIDAVVQDITARKTAEDATRAEDARLRAVVQSMDELLFELDTEGCCIAVWAADERLCGIPRDQIVGRRLPDFLAGEGIETLMAAFGRVVRDRQPRTCEYSVDLPVGRRWFLARISPILAADGSCARLCVLAFDISDQKRFEAALAESERFARSTVDALTDHIAIIDDSGEILAVNQAWRDFAFANGMTSAQYGLGANYLDVCDGGGCEGAAASQGIRSVLRGERHRFDLEYSCHSPTAERWFVMRVTRFSGEGMVRLVICHEDITGRKRAEALQREQSVLRGAVAAMEQVLAVVGHELRTPLAGLRAMSEFLLTDGARETAEATNFLGAINEEVVRMSDTVDQLLEAARLNSGRAKWNWSRFSLRQACEDALDSVRPLVDASRVRVTCEIDPEDDSMCGDAEAIRRLVLNLAGNSRKHTFDGEIRVTARATELDGDRQIELRVGDTGQGIAPEIVARLGEAFALNSGIVGANHVGGTGLGLAISKGIAAAHGGTIEVHSTVGRGTIMTVRLRADLPGAACGEGKNMVSGAIE